MLHTVRGVASLSIIYSFIVKWHEPYGMVFTIFDVTWVRQGRVADFLTCWKDQTGNRSVKEVWRIAPLCLMWTILERAECKMF